MIRRRVFVCFYYCFIPIFIVLRSFCDEILTINRNIIVNCRQLDFTLSLSFPKNTLFSQPFNLRQPFSSPLFLTSAYSSILPKKTHQSSFFFLFLFSFWLVERARLGTRIQIHTQRRIDSLTSASKCRSLAHMTKQPRKINNFNDLYKP